MKFTKKEKHLIYKEALRLLLTTNVEFMCIAIQRACDDLKYSQKIPKGKAEIIINGDCNNILNYFPEFARHKPDLEPFKEVWFPSKDIESRKNILEQIIKETK